MQYHEYETSRATIAYPFREDCRAIAGGLLPRDFIVDAVLSLPHLIDGIPGLRKVYNAGSDIIAEIGTDSATVITGILAVGPNGYGELRDVDSGAVFRWVPGPGYDDFLQSISGTIDYGDTAPFETRVVNCLSGRIYAFKVGGTELRGPIVFQEGFNISLNAEPDTLYELLGTQNGITVAAGSGHGAGLAPNEQCADDNPIDYLGSINGITAGEDGVFRLENDPCYRLIPYPDMHTVIVFNDCIACCDCDTYIGLTKLLQGISHDYSDTRQKLETLVDELNDGITDFNARIAARQEILITGSGSTGLPAGGVGQAPGYSTVIVEFINMFSESKALSIVFTESQGTVLKSWHRSCDDDDGGSDGGYPSISITLDAKSSVKFTFLIKDSSHDFVASATVNVNGTPVTYTEHIIWT